MICEICGDYFRQSRFNPTTCCETCIDSQEPSMLDLEDIQELDMLLNPSGRTPAVFYD